MMPNPNRSVLGHEIFAQHSQVSSPQGLLRTFGDIYDALDVIQVAADDVLDPHAQVGWFENSIVSS